MSLCKGCGAEIVWLKTRSGKNIPVDVPEMKIVNGIIQNEIKHEAVTTAVEFDPSYMTSHFATCPKADRFRRSR